MSQNNIDTSNILYKDQKINLENTNMDLKDNYMNLCPLDYHLNIKKLQNSVTQTNHYPGYTKNTYIDLTRQIKNDEPFPTTADFFN